MRKLGIYVVMAIFAGVVSGCLDDDNNYNYKQINWLQGGDFNFENINSEYNLIEEMNWYWRLHSNLRLIV